MKLSVGLVSLLAIVPLQCLVACAPTARSVATIAPMTATQPLAPVPQASASPTSPQAIEPPERKSLPGGLTLEAYPLAGPPTTDPLAFVPLVGSQQELLARHAKQLTETYSSNLKPDAQGRPTMTAEWKGRQLTALVETAPGSQEQTVVLRLGDHRIFSAPAGFPRPAPALQGLWTYDGHWVLEILMATPDQWIGQVYLDGQLLNEAMGYQEAFGFQLLNGQPFYFYNQDGSIGVNIAGHPADLGYTSIPHYECCSGSVLNPIKARSMVAFFAQNGSTWHFVNIGAFGGE